MNILTGVVLCVAVLSYIAATLLDAHRDRKAAFYARMCLAVSVVVAILIGGHWIGVILGKL